MKKRGVYVYLSEEQIKKLNELKKKKGVSKTFIVQEALKKYLEKEAQENDAFK
jgi:predicted DNA-binding protein